MCHIWSLMAFISSFINSYEFLFGRISENCVSHHYKFMTDLLYFLYHIHFLYGLCGEFHSFDVFHYILYLLVADKRESVEELQ